MRLLRVVYWSVVLVIVSFSDFQFAIVSVLLWMGCFVLTLLFMQAQEVQEPGVRVFEWEKTT